MLVTATHRSSASSTCHLSHWGSTPAFSNAEGSAWRKAGREPPERAMLNAPRDSRADLQEATMGEHNTGPTSALEGAMSIFALYVDMMDVEGEIGCLFIVVLFMDVEGEIGFLLLLPLLSSLRSAVVSPISTQ